MGLLLLLTSTLLLNFHAGGVEAAKRFFTVRDITLSIEPSADVTRGANVTLRCRAVVISSGEEALSREYTIYKDSNAIYNVSSTSEDLLYRLPEVRVSDTGKYVCAVSIEGEQTTSQVVKLTVSGLSKPVFRLNKGVVSEGEELKARCLAPGETGLIWFYFYDNSKEVREMQLSSNQAEAELRIGNIGIHKLHCSYVVLLSRASIGSEESDTQTVSVKELPINVVLEIGPQHQIYEGDRLSISCSVSSFLPSSQRVHLFLSQGTRLLSYGETNVNHSLMAQAKDPGEFECKLQIGNVIKVASKTVSVTELFSVPTFTMSPAEVFQRDSMTLTCKSERYASERIRKEEVTYTLDPPDDLLIPKGNGVFYGRVPLINFNYTCAAQAKGIVKHSESLTVQPKVTVSIPNISVPGMAILGQPFDIHCQSKFGSPPINYTLVKDSNLLSTITVEFSGQPAVFPVTIARADEIKKYMCEAQNGPREGLLSKRLDAAVIEPLTDPTLTVIPNLPEISEGDHLYLICGVKGTPPVTFRWYRVGSDKPVHTAPSSKNNTNYQIPVLSKLHSGTYYCEAFNAANNVVRSDPVAIEVRLALWKKAVIGGFCLLALSVLVVVCVLCFRSKRGKREAAAELSVKPSSPKSDLTRDTEVYNTATVRVDKAAVSVWTKKPSEADTANDEESSVVSNEQDVEYTEVVHPQAADPAKVPLRKGTDTVYSELQNSDSADLHHYGSVAYAELNTEQPDISHYHPEVNRYQDLPEPVD